MDIKFSKNSGGSQSAGTDGKGKQNVLLVVLLVLVGGFSYIYFFTGLINPTQEQKSVPAPVAQVDKKPLPSPDGTPAKVDAGDAKTAAAAPAGTPAPATPVAAPAAGAAAKPAVNEPAKPKEEPKAVEDAQPAVKKPLPATGKADAKKPAPVEKKQPVVAEVKPQPVKEAEKKPVEVKKPAEVKKPVEKPAAVVKAAAPAPAKKTAQKPVKKAAAPAVAVSKTGNWTVLVGNYVIEEAMTSDLGRVRNAGQEAFIVPGPQKKTHMNRLLLAEFTDLDSARAELAKLKRVTADAFMVDSGGMHGVYAGSYLLDARAASERERLAAAGFRLTLKRADVSIPTKNLTAGSFAEKSAAEAVLKKLRAANVKATLTRQ